MLVPRLNEPRNGGITEHPEIDPTNLGAERSTGRDHLNRLRGMAFRCRCSGQRHLCLQSALPYREHSTQRLSGNGITRATRLSLSRRRGGAAAVTQLEIEVAPVDEHAERLAQDENRIADI